MYPKLDPNQYDQLIRQEDFFNLLPLNNSVTTSVNCLTVSNKSEIEDTDCGSTADNINYICKSG